MCDFSTQRDGAGAADTEAEPAGQVPEREPTLTCDKLRESCGETVEKGKGLVMNEADTPEGGESDADSANVAQARRQTRKDGRRRPRPPSLDLVSFIPRVTSSNPEGEASGEGSADASTSPAFVVLTPTALSAELERSAQDTSADRNIVSLLPPIMTHDFSEPRS